MKTPTPFLAGLTLADLPRETLASVVVFLVALPLCMGVAIASGVPPALGLVTGIVGGLVVGAFAGSPLQVSGPAAGLAVIVFDIVQSYGLPALGVAVLLTGVVQMAAGRFGLGRWFRATSPAVIKGMLSGIGLLILGSQFHILIDDVPPGGGLVDLMAIPAAVVKAVSSISEGTPHHLAAAVGLVSLVCLAAWPRLRPSALKAVPGPLLAVIVATAGAAVFALPIAYVDVPADLTASFIFPGLAQLPLLADPGFLGAALGLAAIASAETLLCATAVDRLHDGQRTHYDQELFAQGLGNTVCGVLGALPVCGVIVRSSANVEAGAKSRASAVLHGLWLLGLVAVAPFVLRAIPIATLAAILVYTGWKLFDPKGIADLYRVGRGEAAIFATTLGGILVFDLLTGVVLGVLASGLRLLMQLADLHVQVESTEGSHRVDVRLHGAATFASLPKLAAALEGLPRGSEIHLHLDHLSLVDHAALELIASVERSQANAGGELLVEWDELWALAGRPSAADPLVEVGEAPAA